MKKILSIISSVNGSKSVTNQLASEIVSRLVAVDPLSEVKVFDLNEMKFPHINDLFWSSLFSNPDSHTEEQIAALRVSDQAIQDVMDADILVIGAPMYNFGIPSTLKAWIDHISRAGITFKFNADGSATGLVHGKKVYLAISSGGIYSAAPQKDFDFTEGYIRAILGFIGITDIETFRVEGVAIPDMAATAISSVVSSIDVRI